MGPVQLFCNIGRPGAFAWLFRELQTHRYGVTSVTSAMCAHTTHTALTIAPTVHDMPNTIIRDLYAVAKRNVNIDPVVVVPNPPACRPACCASCPAPAHAGTATPWDRVLFLTEGVGRFRSVS